MAMVMISSKVKFWKNDGTPAVGWKIWTYEAGTTTPKTSWSDEAGTVANANPVVLDSRGEAVIRLKGSYKIKLTDENDNQIWVVDNQTQYDQRDWSGLTATIAELNATNTSTLTKTADYAIIMTDRGKTIAVDATAATPTTVTLLNATAATNGYQITIKKIDLTNNVVNIEPATAQIIDGLDPFVLYDYNDFIKVLSDGSNWHVIAGKIRGSAIVTTTTPLAIDLGDELKTYLIDASSSAFTANLPAINTVARGYRIGFKKTDSSSNAVTINGDGTEQIDGGASVVLTKQFDFVVLTNDGSNWFIIGEYGSEQEDALSKGDISGLVTWRVTGVKLGIKDGICRDTGNTMNMKITTQLVKRIDANWVAGNDNGGFPSGLSRTANTWYHVFIIGKADGTVDAGFDSAINASNLLTDATGYTGYRRIGSTLTDVTLSMDDFIQIDDIFYWRTTALDENVTNPGTSPRLAVLSVPPFVYTDAIIAPLITDSSHPAGTTLVKFYYRFITNDNLGSQLKLVSATDADNGQFRVIADHAKQIGYKWSQASATANIKIYTLGWKDWRGRNDPQIG